MSQFHYLSLLEKMNLSKPKFTGKYDLVKIEGEKLNKNEEKEKQLKLKEKSEE